MWILSIFIGSLLLSVLWFLERTKDITFSTWAFQMLPILILCELFYWYGFRKAPSFITVRYTMSIMTNLMGLVLIVHFLKEPIHIRQAIGAVLIIIGGFIIK